MSEVQFRETQLWKDAQALLVETYRLTHGWPEEGKGLSDDIRIAVRTIVRNVPQAFKKGGITGNIHLKMTMGTFAEVGALCDVAETLGFVPKDGLRPLFSLLEPVEAKFKELAKGSREHAKELMRKRTSLFNRESIFEEDDDI